MTYSSGLKKLYRIPEEGMIKGVCAGLARYFDIPVKLLRVIVVLSLFFGLFVFTIAAYVILVFVLEPVPASSFEQQHTPRQLLDQLTGELKESEQRLRQIERYVTSEAFNLKNRFRQL